MGFLMEFFGAWIRDSMEDPNRRNAERRAFLEYVEACNKATLEQWRQPTKYFGFWNSPQATAQYHTNVDPGVNRLVGKGRTFEDE